MVCFRRVRGLGFACLLLGVGGCGWFGDKPVLKLGFVGGLSGAKADLGSQGRNGAALAVERLNAEGGVAGRKVELVVADDQDSPDGMRAALAQLQAAGVSAVVGPMTSGQTLEAQRVTEPLGLVLISPTASSIALVGHKDHLYRMAPANTMEASMLAAVAAAQNFGRVAILRDTDNDTFTATFSSAFAQRLGATGQREIQDLPFSSKARPAYAQLAQQLRAVNPQGILLVAAALDTALVAQQLRQQGWSGALFTSGWAHTKDVLTANGGGAVEGMQLATRSPCAKTYPAFDGFVAAYTHRFGAAPSNPAEFAYEAVQVWAQALAAENGKTEHLERALQAPTARQGLMGSFTLDAFGDPQRPLCLLEVRSGEFVPVRELSPST
jgi:branched-chain amino acid transport system substrate-binding protein